MLERSPVFSALGIIIYLFYTIYREWHVPTGHCLHVMKGHTAAVNSVTVTTNGFKTVSGSSDSTIKVWNTDVESR